MIRTAEPNPCLPDHQAQIEHRRYMSFTSTRQDTQCAGQSFTRWCKMSVLFRAPNWNQYIIITLQIPSSTAASRWPTLLRREFKLRGKGMYAVSHHMHSLFSPTSLQKQYHLCSKTSALATRCLSCILHLSLFGARRYFRPSSQKHFSFLKSNTKKNSSRSSDFDFAHQKCVFSEGT